MYISDSAGHQRSWWDFGWGCIEWDPRGATWGQTDIFTKANHPLQGQGHLSIYLAAPCVCSVRLTPSSFFGAIINDRFCILISNDSL